MILPLNEQVEMKVHALLLGWWWLQFAVLIAFGFVVEIISPRKLRTSAAGVVSAVVTFVIFGTFVLLGSPAGLYRFGIHPFGLRIDSTLLANAGAVLLGVLTARALFDGTPLSRPYPPMQRR